MFTVEAGTSIVTISELRSHTKKTVEATSAGHPVVVLVDGKPVGALIDMDSLNQLLEIREKTRLATIADQRIKRLRSGEAQLLDHGEFWAAAEARVSRRKSHGRKVMTK